MHIRILKVLRTWTWTIVGAGVEMEEGIELINGDGKIK